MAIDKASIQRFRSRGAIKDQVARVFERSGFEVSWILPEAALAESRTPARAAQEVWGYLLKLNPRLQALFGTAREVLVWVAEPQSFRAKTVMQAQEQLARNRPRICEDFAFVIAPDKDTQNKVDETAESLLTAFVGFSSQSLRELEKQPADALVRHIQTRLFSKDLYFLSTAITSPHAFYGRRHLITELPSALRRGSSHIGLFGLRKMGKTSVLLRVLEALRREGANTITAHLDIQRIDAIRPTAPYFLWSLGDQLFDANSLVRRWGGFTLFGVRSTFSNIRDPESVPELFVHDLRHLLQRTATLEPRPNVVILLDEVELMAHPRWQDAFVRVWRLLRSLDQEFPGRIGFFITGTNPSCIEKSRIADADNPAYNYFDRQFLGPLTEPECSSLLVSLGKPMGIAWKEDAIAAVHRLVGGHPFLLRAFASFLHRQALPRESEVAFSRDKVQQAVEPFLRRMSSTLSQMIEVLGEQYPDQHGLLLLLASGKVGEFREMAGAFPSDVAHLEGYGLVRDPTKAVSVQVELLQSWLQRREGSRQTPALKGGGALTPGDVIEGYVIQSSIGHAGGQARVYRAIDESGSTFALKVLRGGSLKSLQREVEALQVVQHQNIVRFVDYGQTADGRLYIIMEYLDGQSWRSCCQRSTRLHGDALRSSALGLAQALCALHPKQGKIEVLRAKATLTNEELEELEVARYGYVHRDIKPENIIVVEGRGPVLIDFGISVKVADAVVTLSGTPGYIPPDGISGSWDADIDLFQLGVTLLQAATGLSYDGSNLADLRDVCRQEVEAPLDRLILWLTEDTRDLRPQSAEVVRAFLVGGGIEGGVALEERKERR